jgi:hypothetical protein
MCKTLIWEDLKRVCQEKFNITNQDINNGDLTIKFPDGNFIRLKSAEVRENLRGMNIGVAILDEAALFHQEALLEISNRLRGVVGSPGTEGRMIVISTPNGANALYTLFNAALEMPDRWIVRHLTYEQMRVADKNFVEQQRKVLSPLKFAKDYNCVWSSVEDKFFMSWDRTMCVEEIKDNGGDLYTFHDFNMKRMGAVVAQVKNPGKLDGTIEVLSVYAIPNCSTEGIAQAIRRDYPKRNIYSIIDATGSHNNRSTTSPFGVTDRTLLEKYGFTIVTSKKSNPLVRDTDNSSNAFIARGGLRVKSEEKLLLEALDNYHYEDASRIKLVKYSEQQFAHIDSLGDCLRYGINHLFPITHNESPVPDYQVADPGAYRRPGSEYLKQSPLYPGGPTWEELMADNNDNSMSDSVAWD